MTALFDFLSTTAGGLVLVVGTIGLAAAALGAPRWVASARDASVRADISPLWLLMPILLGFVLVWWGNDAGVLVSAFGVKIPALLIMQLVVAIGIVYRYRRWPWLVIPLALLCCLWQWGIMMGVVLAGVNALGS